MILYQRDGEKMIILVGRSASGKTYIGKCLEKEGFKKIVTYTTRPIRIGEVDKVDYNFITLAEFKTKIKDDFFFEYTNYNDNFYGTSRFSLNDLNTYLIVEPEGLLKYQKLKNVVSFYIDAPRDVLTRRMKQRGDEEDMISKRVKNDDIIFKDVKEHCDFTICSIGDISSITKEIKEKYYGRLNLATRN